MDMILNNFRKTLENIDFLEFVYFLKYIKILEIKFKLEEFMSLIFELSFNNFTYPNLITISFNQQVFCKTKAIV